MRSACFDICKRWNKPEERSRCICITSFLIVEPPGSIQFPLGNPTVLRIKYNPERLNSVTRNDGSGYYSSFPRLSSRNMTTSTSLFIATRPSGEHLL